MEYNITTSTKRKEMIVWLALLRISVSAWIPTSKHRLTHCLNELGMNISTAFNIFIRQSLREGRIPFDISLNQPNKETMAAMLEAERIAHDPSVKHCSDVEEALQELKR